MILYRYIIPGLGDFGDRYYTLEPTFFFSRRLWFAYCLSLCNDYSSLVSPTGHALLCIYDCWNSWSMESVDYFNKFVVFHIARF